MKKLLGRQLSLLRLRAFKQGVLQGHSRWLAIWGTLAAARLVRRITKDKPIVGRFRLEPGQSLVITHLSDSEPVTVQP